MLFLLFLKIYFPHSNYRTGSSFTGDILSSHPNSTYLFEPFFRVTPFGKPVDDWNHWNESVREFVEDYVTNIFDCDEVSLLIANIYFLLKKQAKTNQYFLLRIPFQN